MQTLNQVYKNDSKNLTGNNKVTDKVFKNIKKVDETIINSVHFEIEEMPLAA